MKRLYEERLDKKAFRMEIINGIIDLRPSERGSKIRELAKKKFDIPYSKKKSLGKATIYKWLKAFIEANPIDKSLVLIPKMRSDRDVYRKLSESQKNALVRWRHDDIYRTCEELREELMEHESTSNNDVIPSKTTIATFLKSLGLDRKTLVKQGHKDKKIRLSFQSPYPQRLWMADTKGENIKVTRNGSECFAMPVVYIDDTSRFLVSFRYIYKDQENEDVIMQCFKEAISMYGAPEILYVDRGSPYMGNALKKAALIVGCNVIHTKPRDAAAKGKVESIMKLFYQKLECELMTRNGILTLEELNEYANAIVKTVYHKKIHSETGKTPEESFFSFPQEYRRFVSEKLLSLIFMHIRKSTVTKTGLIKLNNLKYLVTDASVWEKVVYVRYDSFDKSRVNVFYDDKFIGEAFLYECENDYLKREQLNEVISPKKEICIPNKDSVPVYGYLERKLAEYRKELNNDTTINEEIRQLKEKKEQLKANLTPINSTVSNSQTTGVFDEYAFTYLLAILLRKKFDANERLHIYTLWNHYGPFEESTVRKTIGTLLGQGHPTSDISTYLEEIKIASLTRNEIIEK
jgi:putative transposase